MDIRPRILIVEDIDDMRESWRAVFERVDYRADGAATAEAAIKAIDRCTYHVALVDIMLAGKDNVTDRGGVKVLKYLRDLAEGTRALVLSAQKGDVPLVRDLLKEYGALDYLAKWEIAERGGNDFLVQKVKGALSVSAHGEALTWEQLIGSLAWGLPEPFFVSECLNFLEFKGGFENLRRSLLGVCQHLVPLLVEVGTTKAIGRDKVPEVFSGTYWSKGQGSAIELLIYGKNARTGVVERGWGLSGRKLLHERTKGDLSVVVIERPDLAREQFGPTSR